MTFNSSAKKELLFPNSLPDGHAGYWRVMDKDEDFKKKYFSVLALCHACATGDKDGAEYLLAFEKTPPSGTTGLGDMPLYAAIDSERPEMVQLLKDYGVNLQAWDLDKHPMTDEISKIVFDREGQAQKTDPRLLPEMGIWNELHENPQKKKDYINTLALCAAIARYEMYCTSNTKNEAAAMAEYLLYREKTPVNGVSGLENAPMKAALAANSEPMVNLLKKYEAGSQAKQQKHLPPKNTR